MNTKKIWFTLLFFHGFTIALNRRFRQTMVESGSQSALLLIQRGCSSSYPCFLIFHRIQGLYHCADQIRFDRVHREANQVANILAKSSLHSLEDKVFEMVPASISFALLAESGAISFPNGVLVFCFLLFFLLVFNPALSTHKKLVMIIYFAYFNYFKGYSKFI